LRSRRWNPPGEAGRRDTPSDFPDLGEGRLGLVIGDIAGKGMAAALLMAKRLKSNSTVAGLFEEWDCAMEERQLSPADTLVLYTDGATESFSQAGEEFGEERLLHALLQHRELCPGRVGRGHHKPGSAVQLSRAGRRHHTDRSPVQMSRSGYLCQVTVLLQVGACGRREQ